MQGPEIENLIGQLARSLGAWARATPEGQRVLLDAAALLRAVAEPAAESPQPVLAVVAPSAAPAPEPPSLPRPGPAHVAASPPVTFTPAPAVVSGPRLTPDFAKRLLDDSPLVRGAVTAPAAYAGYSGPLFDLSRTERRCRVKADACEFALRRQRRIAAGGNVYEFKTEWEELKTRAEALMPCWLWMTRDWDSGIADELLERAREWYLNLASALALAKDHLETHTQQVLERIAEAQSGLRVTLEEASAEDRDTQLPTYSWLREQTAARSIYLPRFLSLDYPADADDAAGARERIERARSNWDADTRRVKEGAKALNDVKYHVKRLKGATPEDAEHFWKKIDAAAQRHAETGGGAATDELAAALQPALDALPDEGTRGGFGPALQAALAAGDGEDDGGEDDAETQSWRTRPTPELLATRAALRGRDIVIVGGVEKANSAQALREAFGLNAVKWLSSGEHQSLTRFEADIARPETALVIVMIRWASHSYEGLKAVAQRHGKMYLRLTGGYSPNQIAHQFMLQNSQRAGKPQPA